MTPISTDAAMTITIPVATKSTAETTKQKDDKEDDEYEPDRHRSTSGCSAYPP